MLHIALAEQLHHPSRSIRFAWRQQEMDVIRHQHIGVDGAAGALCAKLQLIEIEAIIVICEKTGLAVVAALDDVKRNPGERDASAARHGLGVQDGRTIPQA